MDSNEVRERVLAILEDFGMSGKKAAEAMKVSYPVFRNKKNENNKEHTFNEKNLNDLIDYIKKQTEKL